MVFQQHSVDANALLQSKHSVFFDGTRGKRIDQPDDGRAKQGRASE